jgi:hypothetical protein
MANESFFQALASVTEQNKDKKILPYRVYYREDGTPYRLTVEELPEPNIIIKNYQASKFINDLDVLHHYMVRKNEKTGDMEFLQTVFPNAVKDYRNVKYDNDLEPVQTVQRDPNFPEPGYKPSGKYSI